MLIKVVLIAQNSKSKQFLITRQKVLYVHKVFLIYTVSVPSVHGITSVVKWVAFKRLWSFKRPFW